MSYYLKYTKYKLKYFKLKKDQIGANSSRNCVYNEQTNMMENECPGLIYFNQIKDQINKDPDAIYSFYGHGCDLHGELLTVPPGCKYITRIACGISAQNEGHDTMSIGKDFLNNSLDLSRLDKYEKIFNSSPVYTEEFRTHIAGEKYVNSKNSCFLEFDHGFGGVSGLRKYGDPIVKISDEFNLHSRAPKLYTLRQFLLICYEGSLYPTTQQINRILDETKIFTDEQLSSNIYNYREMNVFRKLISDNFSIDYASIMSVLPGTFINKSCRPICRGRHTKDDIIGSDSFIQLSRKNSAREIYTEVPPSVQEKLDTFESTPEIPFLPLSEVKKI